MSYPLLLTLFNRSVFFTPFRNKLAFKTQNILSFSCFWISTPLPSLQVCKVSQQMFLNWYCVKGEGIEC